ITSRYDNLSKFQDGSSYLIVDDEEDTLTFLKSVAEMNYSCLVITRNKPDYIKKIFKPKKIQIAVLKEENDGSRFVISNLNELYSMIKQFCRKHDNTAILITGMDYLLNSYSFDEILKTIYRLNDVIHESTTLFFMRISDQTIFTEKQMKSLQSELKVLPLPSISDFIVDIQLMDILRYIQKEGKQNSCIASKKLRKELGLSRPTIRKKTRFLEENGLVEIAKKGREKNFSLTNKGKKAIKEFDS
ncbi:MAG: hypothetical protein DRN27_07790, partial [Thermoplasmata archaeon]